MCWKNRRMRVKNNVICFRDSRQYGTYGVYGPYGLAGQGKRNGGQNGRLEK